MHVQLLGLAGAWAVDKGKCRLGVSLRHDDMYPMYPNTTAPFVVGSTEGGGENMVVLVACREPDIQTVLVGMF